MGRWNQLVPAGVPCRWQRERSDHAWEAGPTRRTLSGSLSGRAGQKAHCQWAVDAEEVGWGEQCRPEMEAAVRSEVRRRLPNVSQAPRSMCATPRATPPTRSQAAKAGRGGPPEEAAGGFTGVGRAPKAAPRPQPEWAGPPQHPPPTPPPARSPRGRRRAGRGRAAPPLPPACPARARAEREPCGARGGRLPAALTHSTECWPRPRPRPPPPPGKSAPSGLSRSPWGN